MQLANQTSRLLLALVAYLALAQYHVISQIAKCHPFPNMVSLAPKKQDGNGKKTNSRLKSGSPQTNG